MAKKGRSPSLISGSNGKPSPATAKKRRACKRCKCTISHGENLFEIPQKSGGFSGNKPFCMSCFKEILDQTKKDIDEIELLWEKHKE